MGQRYSDRTDVERLHDEVILLRSDIQEYMNRPRLASVVKIGSTLSAYWSDGSVYIMDNETGQWSYDGAILNPVDDKDHPNHPSQ